MLPLLLLTHLGLHAQVQVHGKIRSKHAGDSITAFTIMVKGTGTGTTTDPDGGFRISVPSLPSTLLISAVSFQDMEIEIRSRDAGLIQLEPISVPGQEIEVSTNRIRSCSRASG